jgi:hypothetical protein
MMPILEQWLLALLLSCEFKPEFQCDTRAHRARTDLIWCWVGIYTWEALQQTTPESKF